MQILKQRLRLSEERLQQGRISRGSQLADTETKLITENCELRTREFELDSIPIKY